MRRSGCGTRSIRRSRSGRLRLRVSVVWSTASMHSGCLRVRPTQARDGRENAGLSHRRPLGRRTSSSHLVTARLTMLSPLQTQGTAGHGPARSSASCLLRSWRHATRYAAGAQAIVCSYILREACAVRLLNRPGFNRHPKGRTERDRESKCRSWSSGAPAREGHGLLVAGSRGPWTTRRLSMRPSTSVGLTVTTSKGE
jgi:hypothetical protein